MVGFPCDFVGFMGEIVRYLVRFPDPLVEVGRENECPESGEFFFHGRLWQKFSLKVDNSAQNWLSPHVISHFLIDQPRTSALGAAVELLFCLPPVWESSATNLGFSLNCISQLDFFHICFIFVFIRSLAAFTIRHAVVLRQKNDQTSIQNFIADCGTKF